jgi:MFS family permease
VKTIPMSMAPRAVEPPVRAAAFAHAGVAAAAMVCTLPGRTHGLGLITEPLLADLALDRVAYAALNFWATLLGAAFCVPCGWLVDRWGIRPVLSATLLALGAVVLLMARLPADSAHIGIPSADVFSRGGLGWAQAPAALFVLVLLTRGLGQSALSVVSLALVGRAGGRKAGPVIGVYSFLVAVGFMAAFGVVKVALERFDLTWRELWGGMGLILVGAGVLAALFSRTPTRVEPANGAAGEDSDLSLGRALLTPAFWTFGLATSFYGLVASGLSLFNQSVLAERHFDRSVFLTITVLAPIVGLAANLLAGLLAARVRLGILLAIGLLIQTAALALFPRVSTLTDVYVYAVAMGVAGGMMTVIFFTAWGQMFGLRHLGQIMGAAQLLTVVASAAGPLVLAAGHRAVGSYAPVLQSLAGVSAALALAVWFVPTPRLPEKTP